MAESSRYPMPGTPTQPHKRHADVSPETKPQKGARTAMASLAPSLSPPRRGVAQRSPGNSPAQSIELTATSRVDDTNLESLERGPGPAERQAGELVENIGRDLTYWLDEYAEQVAKAIKNKLHPVLSESYVQQSERLIQLAVLCDQTQEWVRTPAHRIT